MAMAIKIGIKLTDSLNIYLDKKQTTTKPYDKVNEDTVSEKDARKSCP